MPYLFAVGLISILSQVVILRELSVAFYGIELIYVLALGAWMLCSAAGALLGRVFPSDAPVPRLRVFFLLVSVLLPADVLCTRAVRVLFSGVRGAFLPFESQMAAMLLVLLPVALLLGLLFQWAAAEAVLNGATLARAYAVESLGGLFGGLAATGLVVLGFANLSSALVCSVFALVAAEWRIPPGSRGVALIRPASVLIAGALALAFWSGPALDFRSTLWTHPYLAETRDSPYGRVTVEQPGSQVSVFENDALSFNSEGTESEEFVHLAALQHPAPASVLVLGGGPEGIVAEVLLHRPTKVDDIELNPVLAQVAQPSLPRRFTDAGHDPAVTVTIADPRDRLNTTTGRYDLVLIGMPEPSSGQTNRFYTREFFSRCRSVMNAGGVLALRISSSENAWTPQIAQRAGSIHRALRDVFQDIVVIPGATDVFIAGTGALCRDPEVLAARLAGRGFAPRLVSAPYLRYVYTNDRFQQAAEILAKSSAPVNSDTRPVCYQYTAMIWLSKFFPRLALAEPGELRGPGLWLGAALAVVFAAGLGGTAMRRVMIVGAAGFFGTVLEIVLILRYQVTSGVLYQNLGLLLTGFMAGLAAGAWLVDMASRRFRLGLVLAAAGALLALGVGWQLHAGFEAGLPVTSLQLFFAGSVVAAVFAYASRRGGEPAALIAPLYAADLIGGCLGTLLGSLLLVPLAGLTATALWMIPAALTAALL
jgi:spermidine synthase